MKVAVISWKFENFGTLLQAYALNYFLNQIDTIDCDFVFYDLDKNNLDIPFRLISLDTPSKIWNKIFKIKNQYLEKESEIQKEACSPFFEKIKHTKQVQKHELYKLNEQYDVFICGSDQIWNPCYFDKSYFLDFVRDDKKKIAYAPSLGGNKIPLRLKLIYRKLISRFDYLSAREKESCDLITLLTKKKCEYVTDPTILLSSNEWLNALNIKINNSKGKYLLCYFLSPQAWYKDYVISIAEKYNLHIAYLNNTESDYFTEFKDSFKIVGGPEEFVSAIANAQFIITDSFHGTLFSVFFEKNFITLQRFKDTGKRSENNRVTSFLNSINILNRFVYKGDKFSDDECKIDYKSVNTILYEKRNHAKQYIQNALFQGEDI